MRSAFETLPGLGCATTALFLDFDGTLTPIVDSPELVRVDARVMNLLGRLTAKLDGALAVISGRDIATLDRFLAPHVLSASGVHGFENRIADAAIKRLQVAKSGLAEVAARLETVASSHEGLLLERKPASVALHYRGNPSLYDHCRQAVSDAVAGLENLFVVHGKMVTEVKGHRGNKGSAIKMFMKAPPFRSRTPVFLGDDVTDEAGFAIINSLGGISIKVGDGESIANYRLNDTAEVADWLDMLIEQCDTSASAGELAT